MAICATLNSKGEVIPNSDPVETCTGIILIQPQDYAVMQLVKDAFTMPDASLIAAVNVPVFVSIVGAYVWARLLSKPANLIK